jgi:hypothetical protein
MGLQGSIGSLMAIMLYNCHPSTALSQPPTHQAQIINLQKATKH